MANSVPSHPDNASLSNPDRFLARKLLSSSRVLLVDLYSHLPLDIGGCVLDLEPCMNIR